MKRLQYQKHVYGMTGDGVSDAPARRASALNDTTDVVRNASDIVHDRTLGAVLVAVSTGT